MFIPLTSEQVEGAVRGAIGGAVEVATTIVEKWRTNLNQRRWLTLVSE
jgi:hypothetical protein